MSDKTKKYCDKVFGILMIIGILAIVLVLLLAVSYSYLCSDDFSWLCGTRDMIEHYGDSHLGAALRGTAAYYKYNEGSYFANFLSYFANPYEKMGLIGFHGVMIAILLFFLGSLYYLICRITAKLNMRLCLFFSALLVAFCTYYSFGNPEYFLWFTGACYYTVELSFAFLALGLFIGMVKTKSSVPMLVISSVCGFLASGGNLIVTGVSCSWLLIAIIMNWNVVKEEKKLFVPFGVSLLGAIVNVVAPGNYARADAWINEGHVTIGDALRDTIICFSKEAKVFIRSSLLISVLIILFLVALFWGKYITKTKISILWMILSWVSVLVLQFVVLFPVTYGEHTDTISFARLSQSYYFVSSIMFMFAVIMTGLCISAYDFGFKKLLIPVGVLAIIVLMIIPKGETSDIKNGYVSKIVKDYKSGNLRNNYLIRDYVLNTLELAETDSDVILFLPYYPCESTYSMGVDENPDGFVNNSVRNWKRIHSLTVYYKGLNYPAD